MERRDPLAAVIRRAQQRDPAAFDELVDRFSGRLFGLLYRLTGSRHDAEDLLQETFLRVVRTLEGYTHEGRFEAWLYRIAVNLARDQLRRQKRHRTVSEHAATSRVDGSEGLAAYPADGPPPDQPLDVAQQADRLQKALQRLPVAEREVIMLRHFSDMSFSQIAQVMDTPLGTALARAHRGLARLRGIMEGGDRQ